MKSEYCGMCATDLRSGRSRVKYGNSESLTESNKQSRGLDRCDSVTS